MERNKLTCKHNDRTIDKKIDDFEGQMAASLEKNIQDGTAPTMSVLFIDESSYFELDQKIEKQTAQTKTKHKFALVALPSWDKPIVAFYSMGLMYMLMQGEFHRLLLADQAGIQKDRKRALKMSPF